MWVFFIILIFGKVAIKKQPHQNSAVAAPSVDNFGLDNDQKSRYNNDYQARQNYRIMNNTNELVTKKYLTESFKDFGETLMKIFVTKEEFHTELSRLVTKEEFRRELSKLVTKDEFQVLRQENTEMKDTILKSNERLMQGNKNITKLLLKRDAEQAANVYRMDRIEKDFGPRITALEEAHKQC